MKNYHFWLVVLLVMAIAVISGCGRTRDASGVQHITVQVFDRGTDGGRTNPTNNNWTRWIQEKVLADENIAVTFMPVPRWQEVTTLNNLMAARTPPDICITYLPELASSYRDLGGLFDMSPYLDTHLADLKEFLGPDIALPGRDFISRYADPETGAIYFIPARRIYTAMRNTFIRKDWLDKLGLPLPSTTEEFYAALVAFRDHDPGNVGRQNVIPFSMGNEVFWSSRTIAYPFIDQNLNTRDRWVNIVVDRYLTMPGYKEGIRFLNRMFNEGLIDPNFPIYATESDQFNNIKTGFIGAFGENWDRIYRDSDRILQDLMRNIPDAELVPISAMTDADGIHRSVIYDAAGALLFIPASSSNPQAAMRYLNWLSRFENYNFLQIGPEGIVHEIENELPKLLNATGPWIQNSPQNIDYTLTLNGLDMVDPELNIRALANGYSWPAEMIENAYRVSMFNGVPDPVIPVNLSAAGPYVQTLIDKGNVLLTQAVMARPADFDRIWEAGISDWLSSGAQIIIDERQEKFFEP